MPPSVRPSDLTGYARIRNAALDGFAAKGIASTSIRDVAAAAGVSPSLVQHYFGTKAGLRDAVNEYVIELAVESFENLPQGGDSPEGWAAMGDTVTAFVRDNASALRYVARALTEDDAEAAKIFDALVEIAQRIWLQPLARAGVIDPDTDHEWAAMHLVMFNLASVLFETAISRRLPDPLFDPKQVDRWNTATTELYRRGFSRPALARRKRGRS